MEQISTRARSTDAKERVQFRGTQLDKAQHGTQMGRGPPLPLLAGWALAGASAGSGPSSWRTAVLQAEGASAVREQSRGNGKAQTQLSGLLPR